VAALDARALAAQTKNAAMQARFAAVARELDENEATTAEELPSPQGSPVDLGGYYLPDDAMAEKEMRPRPTFNAVIDELVSGTQMGSPLTGAG